MTKSAAKGDMGVHFQAGPVPMTAAGAPARNE
jgi:hypothetical protein